MVKNSNNGLMVGLDIGTSRVTAVVGSLDVDGKMNILGYGQSPSKGLNRGVVVNIDATVQSIRNAVEAAEVMTGCQINCAYTGIADGNVRGLNSEGMVPIKDREVTLQDVHRVMDAAKTMAIPDDQKIMHILPQEFRVDKQDNIREPLGMSGVRLEAKVHMITGANSAMENISKCVKRCGLQVNDIILDQLAASDSVLTDEEKELGVCLIDIGAGTTDVVVFQRGAIRQTMVLPVAGDQVTNDIAVALRLPTQTAEQIKIQHACAMQDLADSVHPIEVPALGNCPAQTLTQSELAEVIGPRYEELFEIINQALRDQHLEGAIGAGIVMTGGASMVSGVTNVAEQIFQVPVRVGAPQNAKGNLEVVNNPTFATSVGLLMYAAKQEKQSQQIKLPREGVTGIFSKIKHWFQGNF